ncbi:MAG: hypothetical protein OM95_01280 [Bdellovibrio sp. ArHS]|uniref:hypothetical protein n=1 Tax=Bdellovibrio sp. ArHS TaxID=1569284 RepID=UPI000583D811|nr:hypothetical protein [Bdellovibrio sp. ArHS]KHD89733.1 MAG: hypothetical protein OM95_01280 [Bdellovibrio sp. ArHS]
MKSLAFLLVLLSAHSAAAAVFSPSSVEVKFTYSTEFMTTDGSDAVTLADLHAQHLFGYMQSPTMVTFYKINSDTPGIGAPRFPLAYEILKNRKSAGVRTIAYKVTGVLLLNKNTAKKLLDEGVWKITMPSDLDNFYEEKCTDEHYNSFGDFWYFYDPFREGCEFLRQAPMARSVNIKIAAFKNAPADTSASLDKLRDDNGNGDLFEITTINGYADSAKDPEDAGRMAFEELNTWLRQSGFNEKIVARYQNRPIHQFTKTLKRSDGSEVQVRITRLLAETAVASKNVTFAKFFKHSVENADVVIYAGHSGLGGNLDIASLEEKAGGFEFQTRKHQIFFFDGCSSYSYYLTMFEERKSKGKIDILTNGLSSYFGYETPVHKVLFKHLLQVNSSPTWGEILRDMERPLGGMTFMLNVGSL